MARVSLTRRRVLRAFVVPAATLLPWTAHAVAGRIASARIWPAQEYTRLILEASTPIGHRLILLKDPPRAVLDLDAVGMSPELVRLPALVTPSDPYIARIRFGRQPQDVLSPRHRSPRGREDRSCLRWSRWRASVIAWCSISIR
jgi:N-acetylmuramoyl-L-alanine amidase